MPGRIHHIWDSTQAGENEITETWGLCQALNGYSRRNESDKLCGVSLTIIVYICIYIYIFYVYIYTYYIYNCNILGIVFGDPTRYASNVI